jgi:CO/xanthine dehydrogenase Mo-binding subunit
MNVRTSIVGTSPARLESRAKVTGRASYTQNVKLPGMLHVKVFRSTVAHGRIRRIDTGAAKALPGVHSVITGEDVLRLIPNPYYGPAFHDQPVLALDKVRFVGEAVALVLADDPHVAEQAVQLITADYDALPAVYDEVEALTSSVIVHDELKPAGTFADLKHLSGRKNTNVTLDYQLRRGEVDAAFASAGRVFEHTFRTQPVTHTTLEPFICLAKLNEDTLTLHTTTQMPSFVRIEIARLLGWTENRVRVKVLHLGGGFAAKTYIRIEALAAVAALLARRPVRLLLTMEEQFYTVVAHASTFKIKSVVDRDGRVTARQCQVIWNGGAYADIGPRVAQKSGFTAAGPYEIDNVKIDSTEVYTNWPVAASRRGFGIPKLCWAYESHTDMIARELGIDPLQFRQKNILRQGRPQSTGTIMQEDTIADVLDELARRMNWAAPFDRGSGPVKRGRGIAIGYKAAIAPTTSVAMLTINADGSCNLQISTTDMGQGSDTAMAQVAAEVLGTTIDQIKVTKPDTDITPFDMGTLGSRSTYHMGHAVKRAAEDARDKLQTLAESVGLPPGSNYPWQEVFLRRYKMQGGNVVGTGTFIPPYTPPDPVTGLTTDATPYWMIGGNGVELEVDTETGHVRLTKLITVADGGTLLNPKIAVTQLSGAAIMQIGYALFERMEMDHGQCTNASLADYKIPGMHDVPAMESAFVEASQANAPFGAKGVGESGSFAVAPAIANAIHDAVGVRLTDLPMTPEAVLTAICQADKRRLGKA